MLEFFVPSENQKPTGEPGHMDGVNDMIAVAKQGPGVFTSWKARAEKHVAAFAQVAKYQSHWEAPQGPSKVTLTWVETSKARDLDNIYGGAKYVLDALCRGSSKHKHGVGVINDDSQRFVAELVQKVIVDKHNPGVWVRVEEL